MIHTPRTMAVPASATADSVTLSGCRGLPNEVRGSWAKRARSAAVRHPATMRASVSPMRWRSASGQQVDVQLDEGFNVVGDEEDRSED